VATCGYGRMPAGFLKGLISMYVVYILHIPTVCTEICTHLNPSQRPGYMYHGPEVVIFFVIKHSYPRSQNCEQRL